MMFSDCNSANVFSNVALLPRSRPSLITTMMRFCPCIGRSASSTTARIASNRCGWPFFLNSFSDASIDFGIVGPIRNDLRLLVVTDDQQFVAFENLVSKLARRLFKLIHVGADR